MAESNQLLTTNVWKVRRAPLAQPEPTLEWNEPTVVFATSAIRPPCHEANVNKAAITAITTKPASIIPPSMVSCRFRFFCLHPILPMPNNKTEMQKFLCCGALE